MKKTLVATMILMGITTIVCAQEISGGQKMFMDTCVACHGIKGDRSPPSPVPINTMDQAAIETRLARARAEGGKGRMDRAVQHLTEEESKAVAEFIVTNLKPAP